MNKVFLTDEQIQGILKDYSEKRISLDEMTDKWEISRNTINRVVKENGVEFRNPNKAYGNKNKNKCYKCGKMLLVLGANYCPFCGATVLSKKDYAINEVKKLYKILDCLPANLRDEAAKNIKSAVNLIYTGWGEV